MTFANANRNAVRDELLLAQGADGTGKIGIAQVSASERRKTNETKALLRPNDRV